jgi:hypothetical protein
LRLSLDAVSLKRPKFAEFVNSPVAAKACNYLTISDFLIEPIQRIPRYVMLLEYALPHTYSND